MASFSQALALTTTMLVSSTVLYHVFTRQSIAPTFQIHGNHHSLESNRQILRFCLYSAEKKRDMTMKKKKKVQFADTVMKTSEAARKKKQRKQNRVSKSRSCRDEILEIQGMPANRVVLYNGILRDRMRIMESAY